MAATPTISSRRGRFAGMPGIPGMPEPWRLIFIASLSVDQCSFRSFVASAEDVSQSLPSTKHVVTAAEDPACITGIAGLGDFAANWGFVSSIGRKVGEWGLLVEWLQQTLALSVTTGSGYRLGHDLVCC